MKVSPTSRIMLRVHSVIFFLLFSGIILMLGWLSLSHNVVVDWTYGKRNSLSESTLTLLPEINNKITIRSYQPKHALYQKRAREILTLYQRHHSQLDFQLVDLNLDIDLAKTDGISREGQSVIKLNGRSEIINSLQEQDITNALIRLHRNTHQSINFLTGHGERKISNKSSTGYQLLAQKLLSLGFQLHEVNLLRDDILTRLDQTLVIAAPEQDFLATEIQQINNFIDQGGNLLWLQDPAMNETLKPLANTLNIEFHKGVAIDNDENLRDTLGISHPAVIAVISYKLHAITEKMDYFTLFITAAALKTIPPSKKSSVWSNTSLLLTQDNSWSDTDGFILGTEFNPEKGDIKGPLNLGLALERNQQNTQQRVVVLGDSDFISNNNLGQGANLTFITNSLNWLARDDSLISILPQIAPDTRLDLSNLQKTLISITFLIALPLILLSTGSFIWYKRKKQ